jgi:hypothetical protein
MNEYAFTWALQPAGIVTYTFKEESGPFIIIVKTDRIEMRVCAPETHKDQLVREAGQLVSNLAKVLAAQYHVALQVGPQTIETYPSDRPASKDIEVGIIGHILRASIGTLDPIVGDVSGNIIDSSEMRRDREQQEQARRAIYLAAQAAQDSVLSEMLGYRKEYECDPLGRLHHLYDILRVAQREYGGRKAAATGLHLSFDDDLDKLGRISCNPELTNGRHRGDSPGPHRPATSEEVATCERVADAIIDARAGFRPIPRALAS